MTGTAITEEKEFRDIYGWRLLNSDKQAGTESGS